MSGKIDKYEYLTSKEILPSDQSIIIGQAKFTHFPLGKAFEKQTNNWRPSNKTSWSFKSFKTKRKLGTGIKDFFQNYIKLKNGKKIKRKDLIYKINKYKCDF